MSRDVRISRLGLGIILAAAILSAGLAGAVASTLQQQTAGAKAAEYGVSFSGVPNFPSAPLVAVTSIPAGYGTCVSSLTFTPGTWSVGAVAVNGSSCRVSDYSIQLGFVGASTMASETDTFVVYATFTEGNGTVTTGTADVSVTVNAGTNGSQGVDLDLDFGQRGPVAELQSLSVVVS